MPCSDDAAAALSLSLSHFTTVMFSMMPHEYRVKEKEEEVICKGVRML